MLCVTVNVRRVFDSFYLFVATMFITVNTGLFVTFTNCTFSSPTNKHKHVSGLVKETSSCTFISHLFHRTTRSIPGAVPSIHIFFRKRQIVFLRPLLLQFLVFGPVFYRSISVVALLQVIAF